MAADVLSYAITQNAMQSFAVAMSVLLQGIINATFRTPWLLSDGTWCQSV